MTFLDSVLILKSEGDKKYIPLLLENEGYPLFKEIRLITEENSKELEKIISDFRIKTYKEADSITITILVGYIIGLLLLIVIFIYLFSEIKQRALTEKRIAKQAKELLQINRTKDMFFSIIAHDLKGPFNSLLNLFSLLKDAVEKNEIKKLETYTYAVEFSARRTYNLLQNLLEWSKLQTGKIKSTPEYFNIKEVILNNIEL